MTDFESSTKPISKVANAMLALFPQTSMNFDMFRFMFMGINTKEPDNGVAMLGLSRIKPEHVASALMVCKYRLENIDGDAYAIANSNVDGNGVKRLFIYTTQIVDGRLIHDTDVFINLRNEAGEPHLCPLPENDWVFLDPEFTSPDPRYRNLFAPLDPNYSLVGQSLDRHPHMLAAQTYFGNARFSTSTLMMRN